MSLHFATPTTALSRCARSSISTRALLAIIGGVTAAGFVLLFVTARL